jgi:hypothetical protein
LGQVFERGQGFGAFGRQLDTVVDSIVCLSAIRSF